MDFISVLFFACVLTFGTLQVCNGREIILNEDKLMGTCTGTCPEIPTLHKKEGCKQISGCRTNSEGWTRGFVRCDYCKCNCEEDTAMSDVAVVRTHLSITEPDLLGTCTSTCDKRGLVRSNFKDCQEVRDCYKARSGWTRGWVRCDYCTCGCINRKHAKEYTLTNVKYDLSNFDLEEGAPIALAETILENSGDHEQTATRDLTFTTTETTTMETSYSIQVGLSVTVTATAGIPDVASVGTSVTASLTAGFSYSAGSSSSETKSDGVSVSIKVPPHSSITAIVTGKTRKIDIPYSATMVTTYGEGSTATKRSKPVTGVYSDVETTRFRVKYKSAIPIKAN